MNIKLKVIVPIISITAVAVMIIWNVIAGPNKYSWLSVFVAGILIAILSIIGNNKKEDEKANDNEMQEQKISEENNTSIES